MKGKLGAVLLASLAGVVLAAAIATAAGDIPGSFSPTGSMGTKRLEPAAAPLPDGRVLVAGA
jgi:hypothetical protein